MIAQQLAAGLRSVKLTLALLAVLAVMALVGTIPRAPEAADQALTPFGGLERLIGTRDTFSSPAFIAVTVLLTANILFCTARRFGRSKRVTLLTLPDLVMHVALVLVIAGGAVKGAGGVVRTVSVPVGTETNEIFDWKTGTDVQLGFVLRVVKFETDYYPFRARVGLSNAQTGEKIGVVEVAEGRPVAAFGGVAISLLDVDRELGKARFLVQTPATQGPIALSLAGGPGAHALVGDFGFTLVAYQGEERMVRTLINAVLESGLVIEKWLSPNGGIDLQGTRISLTAWGRDQFGNKFAGFQAARDPGAPVFWTGCILLSLALPLHLLAKGRKRERSLAASREPGAVASVPPPA